MIEGLADSTKVIVGPYSAISRQLKNGAAIKEKESKMILGLETATKNCSVALIT